MTESVDTETLLVKIRSADLHVTPAQFDRLCQDNRDLRLELTKEGKLIVLSDLQSKMLEYQRLGVKLGLLIDPQDKQVEIYRSNREVEVIQSPDALDCADIMPGFSVDLTRIL